MGNNDFVSTVKQIPYPQTIVYNKLQDLSNLDRLRDRLSDPAVREQVNQMAQGRNTDEILAKLEQVEFTTDSISIPSPLGQLSLNIVERAEPKHVKFEAQGTPVGVTLWVQLVPDGDMACRMKVTLRAELNMFIRKMVEGKLQNGVEQIADMLARIPYGI